MSLTPDSERERNLEEAPAESKPVYWLLVVLVLGLVVGWLYLQHGDLETAWENAGDWIFWILIAVAWLLPLIAQLLGKARKAAEGSGDLRAKDLNKPGKHSTLPKGEMPDDRPIKPR